MGGLTNAEAFKRNQETFQTDAERDKLRRKRHGGERHAAVTRDREAKGASCVSTQRRSIILIWDGGATR